MAFQAIEAWQCEDSSNQGQWEVVLLRVLCLQAPRAPMAPNPADPTAPAAPETEVPEAWLGDDADHAAHWFHFLFDKRSYPSEMLFAGTATCVLSKRFVPQYGQV